MLLLLTLDNFAEGCLELVGSDVVRSLVLFELNHDHEEANSTQHRIPLHFLNHINKLLFLHEAPHEVLSIFELSLAEVRFLRWLRILFKGLHLVIIHKGLPSHPLEELSIIHFTLTFDELVVLETFLSCCNSQFLHLYVVPDLTSVRIFTSNLEEDLEDTFDEFIKFIETKSH